MTIMSRNIKERRSTRSFRSDPLSEDDLMAILEAGCQAPSTKNEQPWHVIVVGQPQLCEYCDEMLAVLSDEPREYASETVDTLRIMASAPICVFVFYSPNDRDRHEARILSIGAMVENMALEAEERGISSLWCCDILTVESETKAYLREERTLICALVLGYGNSGPRKRHKSVEEVCSRFTGLPGERD